MSSGLRDMEAERETSSTLNLGLETGKDDDDDDDGAMGGFWRVVVAVAFGAKYSVRRGEGSEEGLR